jgi:Uma2 family endonuclease
MAASATGSKLITAMDLMGLGSNVWAEVVNGELIIQDRTAMMGAAGFLHVTVIDNIYDLLKPFVKAGQLGYVLTDGLTYILSGKNEQIELARLPDLSFIRKARIPTDFDPRLPFPGAPDLAVEVMSPGDSGEEVLTKVREYLQAGTEQVWVVYPTKKEVHQYRRETPETVRVYTGEDSMEADTLFPGSKLSVREFFVLLD